MLNPSEATPMSPAQTLERASSSTINVHHASPLFVLHSGDRFSRLYDLAQQILTPRPFPPADIQAWAARLTQDTAVVND